MQLNYGKFQKVIDDLENRGFDIMILANVDGGVVDYTIQASHPSGRTWEIIEIQNAS